jgi:hypothetical protein
MSLCLASGIFATYLNRISNITTRLAHTYHWTRMRLFRGLSRLLAASLPSHSSEDCTINT